MNNRPQVGIGLMIIKASRWSTHLSIPTHILLCQRKGSHGEGEYSTIGGHLEHGESFEDCAIREKNEEAGEQLQIANIRFLHLCNVLEYMPKHYVHIGLLADWSKGDPIQMEPNKGGPWKWFPVDELPKPLFKPVEIAIEVLKTGNWYRDSAK